VYFNGWREKMKIAVAGKEKIAEELVKRGCMQMDYTVGDTESTAYEINRLKPDVIIYTHSMSVGSEWCENNPKKAYELLVQGVVQITDHFGKKFIYLSSSDVFDGSKYFDYGEGHKPSPDDLLGFTLWGGELATDVSSFLCDQIIIVRTSELFNRETLKKGIDLLLEGNRIEMPGAEKRSFLYVPHFVEGLLYIIEHFKDMPELLNLAGTFTMSRYRFWYLIARQLGLPEDLVIPSPIRVSKSNGGLSVNLARGLGVPLFSASAGIEEMLS